MITDLYPRNCYFIPSHHVSSICFSNHFCLVTALMASRFTYQLYNDNYTNFLLCTTFYYYKADQTRTIIVHTSCRICVYVRSEMVSALLLCCNQISSIWIYRWLCREPDHKANELLYAFGACRYFHWIIFFFTQLMILSYNFLQCLRYSMCTRKALISFDTADDFSSSAFFTIWGKRFVLLKNECI